MQQLIIHDTYNNRYQLHLPFITVHHISYNFKQIEGFDCEFWGFACIKVRSGPPKWSRPARNWLKTICTGIAGGSSWLPLALNTHRLDLLWIFYDIFTLSLSVFSYALFRSLVWMFDLLPSWVLLPWWRILMVLRTVTAKHTSIRRYGNPLCSAAVSPR